MKNLKVSKNRIGSHCNLKKKFELCGKFYAPKNQSCGSILHTLQFLISNSGKPYTYRVNWSSQVELL